MSDKCNMCKCYVEDGNCPCHFVNDNELCDFNFELINIAEHDKQIRADAIDELTKALISEIQHKPYMCLDSKDIREIAEKLKENNNEP